MIGNNRIFHLKNGTASFTNSQSDPTMNPLHGQIHAHQNNCGAVLADACMKPFTRPPGAEGEGAVEGHGRCQEGADAVPKGDTNDTKIGKGYGVP